MRKLLCVVLVLFSLAPVFAQEDGKSGFDELNPGATGTEAAYLDFPVPQDVGPRVPLALSPNQPPVFTDSFETWKDNYSGIQLVPGFAGLGALIDSVSDRITYPIGVIPRQGTIEFYVFVTGVSGYYSYIFGQAGSCGAQTGDIQLWVGSDGSVSISQWGPGWDYLFSGPGAMPFGRWNKVTVAYGASGLHLYINNNLVIQNLNRRLGLGSRPLRFPTYRCWGNEEVYYGMLDELAAYNYFRPPEDIEVLTVQAVPGTLWIDSTGAGSGILFKATTSDAATVLFSLRTPSGLVLPIGTAETSIQGGVHTATKAWWGNGLPTEAGGYQITAVVNTSSKTGGFSVVKAPGSMIGHHGTWTFGKDPVTRTPADPEPTQCPNKSWDDIAGRVPGYFADLAVNDPVDITFGNFIHPEVDLQLKSRFDLNLARLYNSLDTHVGAFGRGWSSPYLSRLEISGNAVVFIKSDGARTVFTSTDGETFTGPVGSELELVYHGDAGFWTIHHPNGTEWTFDAQGKILRMAKACCGMGTTDAVFCEYNQAGLLTRVSNPAGQAFTFTSDANGRIIGVADSTGRTVVYTYSSEGNLLTVTDPAGRLTTYSYSEDGFLNRIEKPGNRITAVTYADRRVSTITDPAGAVSCFAWDYANPKLTLTDPVGVIHEYRFTADWKFQSYVVPVLSLVKTFDLDGAGILTRVENSLGGQETFTFTSTHIVQSRTDANGFTRAFEYHPDFHKVTKKTDGLGRVWRYGYCQRGNLISETDPAGGVTSYTYDLHNNRTSKTDPLGRVTHYRYDADGNHLVSVIDPLGGVSSFSYDLRGNLVSSTDPLGRTTIFQYDLLDRLTKTVYPDGRFVEIEYDQAGNVALRRDQLGRETRYTYDLADRLLTTTRPDGTTVTATYDTGGRKTSETDPLGRITRFEYDGLGRLTKTTYPDGACETLEYDSEGRLTARVDALGNRTAFEYDPMGRLLATVDPSGARWESQYDAAGRKIADKDPLNRTTLYQVDTLDRITKVIRPDGSFVTNAFDAVGNLLSTTDALGNQWRWVYDALNRQVQAIRPDGGISTTLFDAASQVLAETDALNRTTRYAFDLGGRRTVTTDALGNVWQNFYDNAGRLIATKDPLGAVSSLTYDIMDRVISQSDALGNVTSFEFDAVGRRVAETDAMGRRSITVYDLRDRPTAEVDPEGHNVQYGYNLAGQRTSLTDAAHRTWRWDFDGLGRVTAEYDPLGNTNRYSFDSVGNRVSWTNARNQTTTYTFNEMNRVTAIRYPDGTPATMSYDLEGREVSRSGPSGTVTKTWDSVGNMTSETFGPWGKKWQYSFDLVGNRVQAIDPEGQVFKYRWDALNRLVSLDPPGRGDEIKCAFDAAGRSVTEERPGVKTTNIFDPAGRLLEMRHERDHGREKIVASRKYTYSAVGNRLTMQDENNDITRYFYNGSDWLTKAVYPDGQQVSYGYNGAGDRIEEKIETPTVKGHGRNKIIGTDTVVIPLTYDAGGRLVSRASDTFVFDPDGNLVKASEGGKETRYAWTSDNRQVRVEKDLPCIRHGRWKCSWCPPKTISEEYSYLPEDWRRITRKANGRTYISVYDVDDESHEYQALPRFLQRSWKFGPFCWQPKLPRYLLLREFIGGPGSDDLEATSYHGRSLWHLKDALGSTIALTNRGGHAVAKIGYDAWGNFRWPDKPGHGVKPCKDEELGDLLDRLDFGRSFGGPGHDPFHYGRHFAATISPYLYASRRFDTFSQTYNNRNRAYNQRYGRFLTKDPIGFNGGNNLWAYANQNPVRWLDPMGLSLEAVAQFGLLVRVADLGLRFDNAYADADPFRINFDEMINLVGAIQARISVVTPDIRCDLKSALEEILSDRYYQEYQRDVLLRPTPTGNWHQGTFGSPLVSLWRHYLKHGNEVGAASMDEYLRKATGFALNAKKRYQLKREVELPTPGTEYHKSGRYITFALDGTSILTFGASFLAP